jgi:hypothetical protein
MKYIFLILFVIDLQAQSHSYFSIIPDLGAIDDKCYLDAVTYDSNYIYTLGSLLTSQDSNGRNKIWDIYLSKFDYHGKLIAKTIFPDSSDGIPYLTINRPLVKINDSLYFYWWYLSENRQQGTSDYEAFILDIKNAKIIRKKRIPRPFPGDYYFIHYCKAFFHNGKVNLMFETNPNDTIDIHYYMYEIDTSLNNFKIDSIGKFNQKLTFYWVSKNQKNEYEFVGEVSKIKNGEITSEMNLFYMKMDSTFKIIKRKDYLGNFNYGFVTADNYTILRNEDNTWVMSAYDWVITKEPDPNYGKPTTLKFSPEFDSLIWKRSMYEKPVDVKLMNSWIYYADKMKDGSGYITAGDQYDQRVGGRENYAVLYKVSENGDSLWTRKYIPLGWSQERTAGTRMSQVKVSDYNTIIMGGIAGDRDQNNAVRAWLLHLDSDGCLVPGCNTVISTNDIISKKDKAFVVYPNPSNSGKIYLLSRISSNEKYNLSLLNLQGIEIYKSEFLPMEGAQYFIEIPEKIKPGEYILQIKNKSNVQIEKLLMVK